MLWRRPPPGEAANGTEEETAMGEAGTPDTARGPDAGSAEREEVFERHRRLLFGVAYDMLGSVHDAEDCVQETWIAWDRRDRSDVAEPRAYLVRSVSNTALNRLRAARARREAYVGPWLPEPVDTAPDAAQEVERADEVSYAMLVVLETLGPVERAVFVLREVFGLPYAEIGEAVEREEAAVRQIAHRARDRVRRRRPRFTADEAERRRLTRRFLEASAVGDVGALKEMLAEDAQLVTDGGGKVRAALHPIHGAEKCARFMAALGPKYPGIRAEEVAVNGEAGVLLSMPDGALVGLVVVEVFQGRFTSLLIQRNPDKLRAFAAASGRASRGGEGEASDTLGTDAGGS
ncbi:RNA polymerase sigma-70 factor [Nocardiopsis halophila]|uniref:RNA polymerase sigma-70 factor n=1 Tax=Nocardiopsis halophila TaxID=141692 RepID=UPI0003490BF4